MGKIKALKIRSIGFFAPDFLHVAFLAFVMIMADSSVTTFAATVGRVRKQKAVQKFEPGESVSYTEILGNAVYFGIVANTVNKQAHMDSNFATKVLNGASGNVTSIK